MGEVLVEALARLCRPLLRQKAQRANPRAHPGGKHRAWPGAVLLGEEEGRRAGAPAGRLLG